MNATHTSDVDDLPPSARFVVFVLEEAGGSIARSELQERTGHPDSTLGEALDRLEAAGVIRRDRADDDLRCVRVEIDEENASAEKSEA